MAAHEAAATSALRLRFCLLATCNSAFRCRAGGAISTACLEKNDATKDAMSLPP